MLWTHWTKCKLDLLHEILHPAILAAMETKFPEVHVPQLIGDNLRPQQLSHVALRHCATEVLRQITLAVFILHVLRRFLLGLGLQKHGLLLYQISQVFI